jgi:hypothetical protein
LPNSKSSRRRGRQLTQGELQRRSDEWLATLSTPVRIVAAPAGSSPTPNRSPAADIRCLDGLAVDDRGTGGSCDRRGRAWRRRSRSSIWGLSDAIGWTLSSTNPFDSALSVTRQVTRRVKSWHDGDMRRRRCAAACCKLRSDFVESKDVFESKRLVIALETLEAA